MSSRCTFSKWFFVVSIVYIVVVPIQTTPSPITPAPTTSAPTTASPTESPTTASPTANPTADPTIDPTSDPTHDPTKEPVAPIVPKPCDIYDGSSKPIIIAQNLQLTKLNILQAMEISFDLKTTDNTNCKNETCNIIYIGNQNDISYPSISYEIGPNPLQKTVITEFDGAIIDETEYGLRLDKKIQFVIFLNDTMVNIHIDGLPLFNGTGFTDFIDDNSINSAISYSLFASSPYHESIGGEITDLCISSLNTFEPTKDPTVSPITTTKSTPEPTPRPTSTTYKKIVCNSNNGRWGSTSVSCGDPDDFLVSCGIQMESEDPIIDVNFGTFVDQSGICHILYYSNVTHPQYNKENVRPVARCCDFKQAWNENFGCRILEKKAQDGNKAKQQCNVADGQDNGNFVYNHLLSCSSRLRGEKNYDFYTSHGVNTKLFSGTYTGSDRSDLFLLADGTDDLEQLFSAPSTENSETIEITNIDDIACYAPFSIDTGNVDIYSYAVCCGEDVSHLNNASYGSPKPTPAPVEVIETRENSTLIGGTAIRRYEPTGNVKDDAANSIYFSRTDVEGLFTVYNDAGQIIGIKEWSIASINSTVDGVTSSYGALFIADIEYANTVQTDKIGEHSDYTLNSETIVSDGLILYESCAQFTLDTINDDGDLDFINGFKLYYTDYAVVGILFKTYYGRQYSCPALIYDADGDDTNMKDQFGNDIYSNLSNYDDKVLYGFSGFYNKVLITNPADTTRPIEIFGPIQQIALVFDIAQKQPTNEPTKHPTIEPTVPLPTEPTPPPTQPPTFNGQYTVKQNNLICYLRWSKGSTFCTSSTTASNTDKFTMTGCSAFSLDNNTNPNKYYIAETDQRGSKCIVTSGCMAIATCCYLETPPENDYTFNIIVAVVIPVFLLIVIGLMFFFLWRWSKIKYFDVSEVDDDTKFKQRFEFFDLERTIDEFKLSKNDHQNMLELQRKNSLSIGLQ